MKRLTGIIKVMLNRRLDPRRVQGFHLRNKLKMLVHDIANLGAPPPNTCRVVMSMTVITMGRMLFHR